MRKTRIIMLLTSMVILVVTSAVAMGEERLIPRSSPGDKGKYYLLDTQRTGDIVRTLHKRVGVDSIGWTRTEINCTTRQFRVLGYSELSPETIKENPGGWSGLIRFSSKWDLVNFVC